ncbi:MAG: response regulator [Candidatus Riflebacteria bacterium]|nr:response regulator [Candidatus Riflebacteria bacterium]
MKKGNALVIEDEEEIRELIGDILESSGYTVCKSPNGADGVEKAQKMVPDVIISDIMMPEMDGFGVLRALRKDPRTAVIPFIFLSAKGTREFVRGGMSLGADDYIVKPFARGELLASVASRIERKKDIAKSLDTLKASLGLSSPHEFRTCLNGIMGFAEIIRSSAKAGEIISSEDLVDYAGMILKSAERLNKLVQRQNEFMELSFILSDRASFSHQKIDFFHDLMSRSEKIIKEIANACDRGEDLILSFEEAELPISEKRWDRIIFELTENAIKFSKKGSPVKISGKVNGNQYILTVEDQGRGMTPDQIRQIGPYIQFERKKFEQQGLGLGLAIVKTICEIYSIDSNFSSPEEKGFKVELSIKRIPGHS